MADIILTEEETKRFWLKTRWNPWSGCLEWTAGCLAGGYGMFWLRTINVEAHRIAWVLVTGEQPGELCVLHRCDNRRCLNAWDHLFVGTRGDNARDMVSKGRHRGQLRTHCPSGHPYTGENVQLSGSWRRCRECSMGRQAAYRSAHREELAAKQRARNLAHRTDAKGHRLPALLAT